MSARKSGVTLLVAELSKMNAFKEAEESLTYLLPTTRTFLRYITGKRHLSPPDVWGTSTGCTQRVCELQAYQTSLSASAP